MLTEIDSPATLHLFKLLYSLTYSTVLKCCGNKILHNELQLTGK